MSVSDTTLCKTKGIQAAVFLHKAILCRSATTTRELTRDSRLPDSLKRRIIGVSRNRRDRDYRFFYKSSIQRRRV
jgi:hypothetical protein